MLVISHLMYQIDDKASLDLCTMYKYNAVLVNAISEQKKREE